MRSRETSWQMPLGITLPVIFIDLHPTCSCCTCTIRSGSMSLSPESENVARLSQSESAKDVVSFINSMLDPIGCEHPMLH
jgi:hypothetical protein